jgi:hypothetical protein
LIFEKNANFFANFLPIPSRFNHSIKDWYAGRYGFFFYTRSIALTLIISAGCTGTPLNKVVDRLSHGSGSHSGLKKGSSTDSVFIVCLQFAENCRKSRENCDHSIDPRFGEFRPKVSSACFRLFIFGHRNNVWKAASTANSVTECVFGKTVKKNYRPKLSPGVNPTTFEIRYSYSASVVVG